MHLHLNRIYVQGREHVQNQLCPRKTTCIFMEYVEINTCDGKWKVS